MDWVKGTKVRPVYNPGHVGECTGRTIPRGPTVRVQVKFPDATTEYISETELELADTTETLDEFELIEQGKFGRAADLRRNLTYLHLSGRLANLVYSMGVTNTDFYPHQYKPLLTLLDSPAKGLLIADEVGLGKTIEAGIIWTELRARYDMRRLLVVCPAMLREKWQDELGRRFGIVGEVVGAAELLEQVASPLASQRDGHAWITSYQAIRPPRDWRADAKGTPARPSARWKLADFLHENAGDAPLFDLVIFDEAHYMRNEGTGAQKSGTMLRDVTDYLALLSATPINLANDDLFNLLQLADPDHFQYRSDFAAMLAANRPLVAARDGVLKGSIDVDALQALLAEAAASELLEESLQLRQLRENLPTDVELADASVRARLAEALERMNLLSHTVTRTRKRDIHLKRPKRDVHKEAVEMTPLERRFYEAVTDLTREFAFKNSISDGFLLAMPQRQVASCPAATAHAWNMHGDDWINDYRDEEDPDDELLQLSFTLREFLQYRLPREISPAELEAGDSKYGRLLTVLQGFFAEQPDEKVILFTSFRQTAHYLSRRLKADRITNRIVWGGMDRPKQELIDEFRENAAERVLISTEVAAEGVDLQFCHVLVNYDLPWNPMRVEQRIGRIDRLGQTADVLVIWNLYFKESIDDRIVIRLMNRLRVFEEALGEAEAVVGAEIARLESDLLTRKLSPEEEERRVNDAVIVIENNRRNEIHLEENSAQLIAHGGLLQERIEAARDFSRRVTEDDLFVYVRDYLLVYAPGHRFDVDASNTRKVLIQLPPALAAEFDGFLRSSNLLGQTRLAGGDARPCEFKNSMTALRGTPVELINQFHPLIKFISAKLREAGAHFFPLVALTIPAGKAHEAFTPGNYMFCVKRWHFGGLKDEEQLAVALRPLDGDEGSIRLEQADLLVDSARLNGRDWLDAPAVLEPAGLVDALASLQERLDEEFSRTTELKRNENIDRANYQRSSVERNFKRQIETQEAVLAVHREFGRKGLVTATLGKIEKLRGRLEYRLAQIGHAEKISPTKHFVCGGVIRVEG
jgi:SNF2 family DNA or RNA helicase